MSRLTCQVLIRSGGRPLGDLIRSHLRGERGRAGSTFHAARSARLETLAGFDGPRCGLYSTGVERHSGRVSPRWCSPPFPTPSPEAVRPVYPRLVPRADAVVNKESKNMVVVTRRSSLWLSTILLFTILLSACGAGTSSGGSNTGGAGGPAASSTQNAGGSSATPGGTNAGASGGKEVVVGVILPLTGANGQNGQNSLRGIQLVTDEINSAGGIKSMGGAKIKLQVADSTSDPTRAASATQQFLSGGQKPVAMIGAYASGLTITVAQVTEKAQIPLITTGFTDELTGKGYKYIFRIPPRSSQIGKLQMQYAIEIANQAGVKPKKVAIAYTNDAFGTAGANGIKAQAEKQGLQVVLFESYDKTSPDLSPVVRKITGAKPDILFPVSYISDGVLLVRGLQTSKSSIPIVGGVGGFITPDFYKSLGSTVNGILTMDTSSPDKYGSLGEAYQKKYGTFMPQEAHDNGVGLSIIAQALEQNPTTDPTALAKTLHSADFTQGYATQMPGGHVKWDEAGNNTAIQPVMVQWQNDKLVTVWPKDQATAQPKWPAGK